MCVWSTNSEVSTNQVEPELGPAFDKCVLVGVRRLTPQNRAGTLAHGDVFLVHGISGGRCDWGACDSVDPEGLAHCRGLRSACCAEAGCLTGAGILRETEEFESEMSEDSLMHVYSTGIQSSLMAELGYNGPDLLVETTQQANETRFVQDASWSYAPYDVSPNAGYFLIFDLETSRPYIMLFALENIRKNEEILVAWGNESWDGLCRKYLSAQAETSQWWAEWAKRLRNTCRHHGIKVQGVHRGLRGSRLTKQDCARCCRLRATCTLTASGGMHHLFLTTLSPGCIGGLRLEGGVSHPTREQASCAVPLLFQRLRQLKAKNSAQPIEVNVDEAMKLWGEWGREGASLTPRAGRAAGLWTRSTRRSCCRKR